MTAQPPKPLTPQEIAQVKSGDLDNLVFDGDDLRRFIATIEARDLEIAKLRADYERAATAEMVTAFEEEWLATLYPGHRDFVLSSLGSLQFKAIQSGLKAALATTPAKEPHDA